MENGSFLCDQHPITIGTYGIQDTLCTHLFAVLLHMAGTLGWLPCLFFGTFWGRMVQPQSGVHMPMQCLKLPPSLCPAWTLRMVCGLQSWIFVIVPLIALDFACFREPAWSMAHFYVTSTQSLLVHIGFKKHCARTCLLSFFIWLAR